MLRKAVKVTLYDDVVGQLEQLIRRGDYKPNDRLPPERQLSEQLGISRNTLREALKALNLMGVLEVKQGGGNYVSSDLNSKLIASSLRFVSIQNYKDVYDLLEARRVLEVTNAGLAARNATPELIAALTEDLRLIKSNFEDTEVASTYDSDFHFKIAEASGNMFLLALTRVLSGPLFSVMLKTTYIDDLMHYSIFYHEKILEAVTDGDAIAAERYMGEHLMKIENAIREKGLEGIE